MSEQTDRSGPAADAEPAAYDARAAQERWQRFWGEGSACGAGCTSPASERALASAMLELQKSGRSSTRAALQ